MNLQTILPYVPFLAIVYALFALIQALRHQKQGIVATLLALVAVAAPVIAYIVSSDADVHTVLLQSILINAAVVFIASLITLLIERRNPQGDPSHSYGMFGIGVSMILVVAMFALPLLLTSSASANTPNFANSANTTATTATANTTKASSVSNTSNASSASNDNGQIVLASDNASENPFSQSANTTTSSAQTTNESAQDAAIAQTTVSAPLTAVTAVPTEAATEAATVVRPTPIVFPTDTPTPEASAATAAATGEAADNTAAASGTTSDAATCTLVTDYDLNLRTQPSTSGTVLLSIPVGTTVTTTGKTSDGWYQVSYNDQSGWVNGQYATPSASCSSLATVSAS